MPKDGRGKKTAKGKGRKSEDTLAERVSRVRQGLEDLSARLAAAEETLRAAGTVAITEGESRMSRLLALADAAGAKIEKELGSAVAALFEGAAGDSKPAPPPPAPPVDGAEPAAPKRAPRGAAKSAARPAASRATTRRRSSTAAGTASAPAPRTRARRSAGTTGDAAAAPSRPRRRRAPSSPPQGE